MLEKFANTTCPGTGVGAEGCALATILQCVGSKSGWPKAWGLLSRRQHLVHLQSLVLVESSWRSGLQHLLQPKRLCHTIQKGEIILFLRVCANWLKANTHYFPLFFVFFWVSKKFQDSASVLGILFRVLRNQTGLTVGIQHCGRNSSHLNANVF